MADKNKRRDVSGKRAARLLASYGASPKRWPAAERDPLADAVAADRELLSRRVAEGALDHALDDFADFDVPADLADRIRDRARRERVLPAWQAWLAQDFLKPISALVPASTLVAAVALGVLVGAVKPSGEEMEASLVTDAFVSLAFGPAVATSDASIHSEVPQ